MLNPRDFGSIEKKLFQEGFCLVAGVDEAGRGPLAGPVVASACILSPDAFFEGLDDSKKLSARQREKLYFSITAVSVWSVGIVDSITVDEINILQATFKAMQIALENLPLKPDFVLFDGNRAPKCEIPYEAIIDGDALHASIAAASILAKYTRDRLMFEFHKKWPDYRFDLHKGYGTELHLKKLKEHGPCPIHRHSFRPVRDSSSGRERDYVFRRIGAAIGPIHDEVSARLFKPNLGAPEEAFEARQGER